MLQDIYPYKLENHFYPEIKAQDNDFVLIFDNASVLATVKEDNSIREVIFPTVAELKDISKDELTYLFSIKNKDDIKMQERYFLYQAKDTFHIANDSVYSFLNMRTLRESEIPPKYRALAFYTGKHLADWYRDSQYCGRCGHITVHSSTERAKICPSCGYTMYPRIMPAVIVAIRNGEKILLTRYRQGYNHNALVAGFTEIGETLEETVEREVMEETGLKVKNICYYKSQPWGVANDILMGYYCDVDGNDKIKMDNTELKYAEWVKREDIELQPDENSLTNEMMKMFKEGKL